MKSFLKTIAIVLSCLIIWIVISPLMFILFLGMTCLLVWKKCVDLYVHINHPDWIGIRGRDSMFTPLLHKYKDQGRSSGNIAVIGRDINPKDICLETMRQTFYKNVLEAPGNIFWKLKCVPKKCGGYYYWAPIPLTLNDLDKYIHKVQMNLSEVEFNDFIGNSWISSSFEGRSPWEVLIVAGDAGQGDSICLRIHHSIGGGIALRNIFKALEESNDSESRLPAVKIKPNLISKIAAIYDCITLPWTLFNLTKVAAKKDKIAIDQICEKQITVRYSLETQTVKNVAKHFKCPFRTVLANITGSAIRRFELENCSEADLPESTQLSVNLPWFYSPISPTDPLNNKATAVVITFPLKISDAIERLLITKERVQEAIFNRTDRFSYYFRQLTFILPAFVILKMSSSVTMSNGSSDLPSTLGEELGFFNSKTANVYALPGFYGLKMGCFVTFVSVGSKIQAAMTIDSNRIARTDDAQRLCEYAKEELETLNNHVKSQQSVKVTTIQMD